MPRVRRPLLHHPHKPTTPIPRKIQNHLGRVNTLPQRRPRPNPKRMAPRPQQPLHARHRLHNRLHRRLLKQHPQALAINRRFLRQSHQPPKPRRQPNRIHRPRPRHISPLHHRPHDHNRPPPCRQPRHQPLKPLPHPLQPRLNRPHQRHNRQIDRILANPHPMPRNAIANRKTQSPHNQREPLGEAGQEKGGKYFHPPNKPHPKNRCNTFS